MRLRLSNKDIKKDLIMEYFGHLMRRTDSFEKTLMLGKIEGGRRRGMATHSSILAWRIPWTEEPFRPQSMEYRKSRT